MKLKEFGLICLWMADRPIAEDGLIDDFAYHFRKMVEDVSEEGYMTEEVNGKL